MELGLWHFYHWISMRATALQVLFVLIVEAQKGRIIVSVPTVE
jgi:hypothetical protein